MAGSDAIATARVLAAAVAKLHAEQPVDVVVAGMAALDGLTSLVPAALAELLGWPQLTLADRIAWPTASCRCGARPPPTSRSSPPRPGRAVVTDQAFRARFPNFKGIMAAQAARDDVVAGRPGPRTATVGLAGSATQVVHAAERPERADRVLVTGDAETVPALVDYLSQKGFA